MHDEGPVSGPSILSILLKVLRAKYISRPVEREEIPTVPEASRGRPFGIGSLLQHMPSHFAKDPVRANDRIEGLLLSVAKSDLDIALSSRSDSGECLACVETVGRDGSKEFAEERGTVYHPPSVLRVTAAKIHHDGTRART